MGFDVMDLVSKAIVKYTKHYGKKVQKNGKAPEIPKEKPVIIAGDGYRCGFAREKIMPDLTKGKTYYIAGHGSGHVMDGVLSDVFIHAVWLDCGGDEGILWLSADCVGFTNVEVQIMRDKILASDKIKGCRSVSISCTHSHSGIDTIGYWGKPFLSIPSDGKDPEYMQLIFETAVKVSEEAYANRRAGKLYTGRIKVEGGLFTKRHLPEKHEILSRLRFVPADGGNETWIMNFGGHPNSLGGGNRKLSGEYPYFMREQIKEQTGADVLFGIGPIGGMDAAELDEDPVECVKKQGAMLADAVQKIDNDRELEPTIKVLCQPFYYPVGNYVLTFLATRGVMSFTPYPSDQSDIGIAMKSEMTLMTFGDQKILLLPGENFVNTVFGGYEPAEKSTTGKGPEINPEPLADIAGDHDMIAFGVTNDMTGYVVPPNDFVLNPTQPYLNGYKDRFGDNHYHETNGMGLGSQKAIADAFRAMVEQFNA